MLQRTIEFIEEQKLLSAGDRILLGVSGGIDSMVMLDLFTRLKYSISVAHCNFSLRGEESDADQELVESACSAKGITIYTRKFDTADYAQKNGISIQMAARKLRFEWFEELRSARKMDAIVLGHNKDDIIETFFINISRGTGIKGLTGIKPRNKYIVRPLLFACRDDITSYAEEYNISFREDSSNIETRYKRNAIRHKIIPVFKDLNPSFISSMEDTIKRLEETENLLSHHISLVKDSIIMTENDEMVIEVKSLLELEPLDIHLYELFKDYGIGQSNIDELKKLLPAPSGKHLDTDKFRIIKDRESLIISRIINQVEEEHNYDSLDQVENYRTEVIPVEQAKIISDKNIACLDFDKISFPITIRKWKSGDWFYPFGMDGKKKLSDFFVDNKVPLNRKNKIRIFISDGNIFWVAGYRIDKRYSVTKYTKRVLIIQEDY
jgi:tRNA(Ile)-lysidine synthase